MNEAFHPEVHGRMGSDQHEQDVTHVRASRILTCDFFSKLLKCFHIKHKVLSNTVTLVFIQHNVQLLNTHCSLEEILDEIFCQPTQIIFHDILPFFYYNASKTSLVSFQKNDQRWWVHEYEIWVLTAAQLIILFALQLFGRIMPETAGEQRIALSASFIGYSFWEGSIFMHTCSQEALVWVICRLNNV